MSDVRQPVDFADVDLYDGNPDGFDVFSWSPGSLASKLPATQVHLHVPLPESIGRLVFRFKSINTIDRLIAALIFHRTDVWGLPTDHRIWMRGGK